MAFGNGVLVGVDGTLLRARVVDVRHALGDEPLTITSEFRLPYEQNDISRGRMKVSGSFTAYFEDKKLLRHLQRVKPHGHWLTRLRRWKRMQRFANFKRNPKRPSKGWRKHIRRNK